MLISLIMEDGIVVETLTDMLHDSWFRLGEMIHDHEKETVELTFEVLRK